VSSTKYWNNNTDRKNLKLFHTRQQVTKVKCCFGVHFGMGSISSFPPTSVMKESQNNYVEETVMLSDNSVLNSILVVPNECTVDGTTVAYITSRGLPNGLVVKHQDINNYLVMYMRFDKVRAGAREKTLHAQASSSLVAQSPSRCFTAAVSHHHWKPLWSIHGYHHNMGILSPITEESIVLLHRLTTFGICVKT
jgi:hypothetical protein